MRDYVSSILVCTMHSHYVMMNRGWVAEGALRQATVAERQSPEMMLMGGASLAQVAAMMTGATSPVHFTETAAATAETIRPTR